MIKILDEYNYNIFNRVTDLSNFGDNVTLKDFNKLNDRKICFVDTDYNLLIIELEKNEHFYKFKNNESILLFKSGQKLFEIYWNGKVMNVLNTSADDYDIKMLNNIKKHGTLNFITQF